MALPPAGPVFRFHPAAAFTAVGISTIPLNTGSDLDLTSTSGPTGGYVARSLKIGATAGNVIYYDAQGNGPYTQAVAAFDTLDQAVSGIVSSGTTAATVSAIL